MMFGRRTRWAIVVAMALLTSGCGADGGGHRDASAPAGDSCRPEALTAPVAGAGGRVEVTLWHNLPALRGGTAAGPFADLVDTFNRSQNRVKVNARGFASFEEMGRRFFTMAPSDGDLPDIVELTWGANRAAIDTGRVAPVQTCADAAGFDLSDFVPQALAATRLDNRQWGLPMGHFGNLFLYDKAAFARAGLDPERPPATLAEMRLAAEALKAAGVAHPLATTDIHPAFWASVVGNNNADGHSGTATEATFVSEDARRAVRWVKSMFDDQLLRPEKANPPLFDDLLALGRGESAMTIALSLDLKDIAKALDQGQAPGFRLGLAPLPTLDGPGASLANGSSLFLGSASSPERRAAAWSFLEWFSAPAQQARWHETSYFFPTRRSAASEPAVTALWARYPELGAGWSASTGPTWAPGPLVGASRHVGAAFDRAVEEIIERGRPLDDALADARNEANAVLAAYNADPTSWVRCHYGGAGCK